jgi:ribulose-phosphate 3-epimerase
MPEVLPAIIPNSFSDLKEKLEKVQGYVSNVQIDIMDGHFAPSISWPFSVDESGNAPELSVNLSQEFRLGFELDMMVYEPKKYLDIWSNFGVSAFIIHAESAENINDLIDNIKGRERNVALAFNPSTGVKAVEQYIERVDFIQCMGNDRIGYHGVELDERVVNIVKDLRNAYKRLIISVDIGVNFETAPLLVEAGANKLISGSIIYNSSNIGEAIRRLSIH